MSLSKRTIRVLIISFFTLVMLVIVPLLSVLNTRTGESKLNGGVANFKPTDPLPGDYLVQLNCTSFQPASGLANFHFIIVKLGGESIQEPPVRNGTLNLLANSKNVSFSNADIVPQVDVSFPMIASTSNNYPFDTYTISSLFTLFEGSNAVNSRVYLLAQIDQWNVDVLFDESPDKLVVIDLVFRRSNLIIAFSIFMGLFMWFLSLSILVLACSVWIRRRKVEPPTISIAAALLFALPQIRNGLPGSPALGVTFDIASYFFCIFIVAISVLLLMWNYVLTTRAEKSQSFPPRMSSKQSRLHLRTKALSPSGYSSSSHGSGHSFKSGENKSRSIYYDPAPKSVGHVDV